MNFEDMAYERPDLAAVDADFDAALQQIADAAGEEEVFAAYDALMDDISHISTMSTLASIHSDLDLSDSYYEEESTLLDNELTRLDNRMNEVTEAILSSSYADAFTERMGSDFVERYEFYSQLNSPEIEGYAVLREAWRILAMQMYDFLLEYPRVSDKSIHF